MLGACLTTASKVMCPHGGHAVLTTTNPGTSAGALMLLESDVHPIVGCPFTIGAKPSPCVTIKWTAGAGALTANGARVLVASSVGQCRTAEGVVQGVAIIASTQPHVSVR